MFVALDLRSIFARPVEGPSNGETKVFFLVGLDLKCDFEIRNVTLGLRVPVNVGRIN